MKVFVACDYDSPPHAAYSSAELADANEKCHIFELEVDGNLPMNEDEKKQVLPTQEEMERIFISRYQAEHSDAAFRSTWDGAGATLAIIGYLIEAGVIELAKIPRKQTEG